MKKGIKIACGISWAVFLTIFIVFAVLTCNNYYFENFALCGAPICAVDKHAYTTNKCPECGGDIMSNGQFVKRYVIDYENDLDTEQYTTVMLKDYYDSWEDFKNDYNTVMVYAIIIAVDAVLLATMTAFNIVMIVRWNKERHKNKKSK
jgi:ABC-type sugar transport system permease subunit